MAAETRKSQRACGEQNTKEINPHIAQARSPVRDEELMEFVGGSVGKRANDRPDKKPQPPFLRSLSAQEGEDKPGENEVFDDVRPFALEQIGKARVLRPRTARHGGKSENDREPQGEQPSEKKAALVSRALSYSWVLRWWPTS